MRNRRKWTDDDIAYIRKARAEKRKLKDIADELGTTVNAVVNVLKRRDAKKSTVDPATDSFADHLIAEDARRMEIPPAEAQPYEYAAMTDAKQLAALVDALRDVYAAQDATIRRMKDQMEELGKNMVYIRDQADIARVTADEAHKVAHRAWDEVYGEKAFRHIFGRLYIAGRTDK